MKTYRIYKITCIPTSQTYIGLTHNSIEKRFRMHVDSALRKANKSKIQEAIWYYGRDYFTIEVIEDGIDTADQAREKERYYINLFESYTNGLNSNSGGNGCLTHTEESKKKMSESRTGIPCKKETKEKISKAHLGKNTGPLSEDHRRKIGEGNKGKVLSEETKQKISQSNVGKKRSQETCEKLRNRPVEMYERIRQLNIGKKRSPETKAKISQANKNRPPASEATREKSRQRMLGKKMNLTKEGRENIQRAARYPRTEEHRRRIKEMNTGKNYAAKSWKVTKPDGSIVFTKHLRATIGDQKIYNSLKDINRKLKKVADFSKYNGNTFPHKGYTIKEIKKIYTGIKGRI